MHARIVVTSSTAAGILASVMVSIRKSGIDVDKHHSEDKEDKREMLFDLYATKDELLGIRNNISKLRGVTGVKIYALKPSATDQEQSGDRDNKSLAIRLSQVYPNVLDIINEQLEMLDKQDAPETLRKAGQEVAGLRKEKTNTRAS